MKTSLAIVHHANQYLITTGYDNREGIDAVIGSTSAGTGLASVLDVHQRMRISMNLHISGTLLEAIAWHDPAFIRKIRKLIHSGLVELIGSCYGQNIMRFFGPDYNRDQMNEELWLYKTHLNVNPEDVRIFWPPERVWETRRMAHVLRDARLRNNGYRYVILDDRLLFSAKDPAIPRGDFDSQSPWSADAYRMYEIQDGLGLSVFPIATRLRRSIPPREEDDWRQVQAEMEAMLVHATDDESGAGDLLAVYADDLEKVSGIGEWGKEGPGRYRRFLEWLRRNPWIEPVLLSDWAGRIEPAGTRPIETGTFEELAKDFNAGEGYEKWYLAPDWAPYRAFFSWAEARVKSLTETGADRALIKLAQKQLLLANWETAWHTPATGPHGDPDSNGHASPWARALTSHSRHAPVIAEAAWWMAHKDDRSSAVLVDIDNDGEQEMVLKNQHLFAVFSPRWGGRLVALFSVSGERGAMVVGNPCDDWNWMEELNRYMDVPRNHPGALADVGFENDRYQPEILSGDGEDAWVRLRNVESGSGAFGLEKEIRLSSGANHLAVLYEVPAAIPLLSVECGFSPDYLGLLRHGSNDLREVNRRSLRGFEHRGVTAWMRIKPSQGSRWDIPRQRAFGHGRMLCCTSASREFEIEIGVTRKPYAAAIPFANPGGHERQAV